jgi:hypothetical protein
MFDWTRVTQRLSQSLAAEKCDQWCRFISRGQKHIVAFGVYAVTVRIPQNLGYAFEHTAILTLFIAIENAGSEPGKARSKRNPAPPETLSVSVDPHTPRTTFFVPTVP